MDSWSEAFSTHLENARWLIEQERGRIDGLHQRASYFLGFSGVILAILPTAIDPIHNSQNSILRNTCWALLIATVLLLALGALLSVMTMGIRHVLEVPAKGLQSRWVEWSNNLPEQPETAQILADYANALLGRETNAKESALLALRAEGDVRARHLRYAMWLTVSGMTTLGALLIGLTACRI